ncbi:MAG TPA: hypothetical protein VG125_12795 [Pirellulales bacterium]|nr:hypothetical protein [Pirellulales bacterium]
MPRIKTGLDERPRRTNVRLADQLAEELKSGRESGQPIIYEHEFPSGKLRVTVIWDEWDRLPLEERTEVILRAYEQAEGRPFRERVALASGLTVPEAHAAGMLPVQIITALRRDDQVTVEECRQAMIAEGASTLLAGADNPQLRFATVEEAEAARKRLIERLPQSEPVWVISQEVGSVGDWSQR